MAVEERLLAEYHARKHAAKAPHVQRVVVHLTTYTAHTILSDNNGKLKSRVYYRFKWIQRASQQLEFNTIK